MLAPFNSATSMQVPRRRWPGDLRQENPARGLVEPDTTGTSDARWRSAEPYRGSVVGESPHHKTGLGQRCMSAAELSAKIWRDLSDPWQFKNVRVV